MDDFINALDELPLIVKIILALPGIDIIWGIYKVLVAYKKNNMAVMVLWIVLYLLQIGWFLCIVDIITLACYNKIVTLTE